MTKFNVTVMTKLTIQTDIEPLDIKNSAATISSFLPERAAKGT